ncbi:MAG: hypothetical protein KDA85_07885 [Planctomycetaceae bacterium]|nr:hypothetical protein [Planctomycetaceae bacterium]
MLTTTIQQSDGIQKFRLSRDGEQLSYADVVKLWQFDSEFQDDFTSILAASPMTGFRWETPVLSALTSGQPFEFVLVDAPRFATRRTDCQAYEQYFTSSEQDGGIVCFPSLGKDAMLVVPSPWTTADVYGHLATFVRGAPQTQTRALWQVLGRTLSARDQDTPIWVSTAGGGVAWLHVRLDKSPKYYWYAKYRRRSQNS